MSLKRASNDVSSTPPEHQKFGAPSSPKEPPWRMGFFLPTGLHPSGSILNPDLGDDIHRSIIVSKADPRPIQQPSSSRPPSASMPARRDPDPVAHRSRIAPSDLGHRQQHHPQTSIQLWFRALASGSTSDPSRTSRSASSVRSHLQHHQLKNRAPKIQPNPLIMAKFHSSGNHGTPDPTMSGSVCTSIRSPWTAITTSTIPPLAKCRAASVQNWTARHKSEACLQLQNQNGESRAWADLSKHPNLSGRGRGRLTISKQRCGLAIQTARSPTPSRREFQPSTSIPNRIRIHHDSTYAIQTEREEKIASSLRQPDNLRKFKWKSSP
ncbi:hypothetical protein ACLOJK_006491 [Asimina triloba]